MPAQSLGPGALYTRQFYERIDPGSRRSAERVVPRVVELTRPRSVADVGCGTGAWLAEFRRLGVGTVLGVDGPWVPRDLLHIPPEEFLAWDFAEPLPAGRRFDLVVSLEVAEHLPEAAAEQFVASLTTLGPIVLFSAATPGQGGDGHLNEKPLAWWEALFATRGYSCRRGFGAQFANDKCVDWWYSRNMVFFVRGGTDFPADPVTPAAVPPPPEEQSGSGPTGGAGLRLEDVQPVVMTCAASMAYLTDFVTSYGERIGERLPRPVVVIDLTPSDRLPGDYVTSLMTLAPTALYVHPRVAGVTARESANDAAFFVLECGLSELGDKTHLLFVEDDVVFSSQFMSYLAGLELLPGTGLLTLYSPGGGYGGQVVEPYKYYGTQCVLFPREVPRLILEHRAEMERQFSPNYDLRWAQWLGSRGYKIRASPRSYVQHIGRHSRIGCNFHSTATFVP